MQDLNDDNLDVLLRSHLREKLDAQLGRAPAAFARSCRRPPWRVAAIWTGAAAALAASIVAGVMLLRPGKPALPVETARSRSPVEYEIAWKTADQGTIYLDDDQPVRSISRQRIDKVRWVDPETDSSVELSIPRDEIMLIGLNAS